MTETATLIEDPQVWAIIYVIKELRNKQRYDFFELNPLDVNELLGKQDQITGLGATITVRKQFEIYKKLHAFNGCIDILDNILNAEEGYVEDALHNRVYLLEGDADGRNDLFDTKLSFGSVYVHYDKILEFIEEYDNSHQIKLVFDEDYSHYHIESDNYVGKTHRINGQRLQKIIPYVIKQSKTRKGEPISKDELKKELSIILGTNISIRAHVFARQKTLLYFFNATFNSVSFRSYVADGFTLAQIKSL